MKKVIVMTEFNEDCRKIIEEGAKGAELRYIRQSELTAEDLSDVDIFVGNIPMNLIPAAKKMGLLQLNSAGSDSYAACPFLPESVQLCNATGAYGPSVSEHMFAGILTALKKIHLYRDNMANHEWKSRGMVPSFASTTIVVIGPGDIGGRVAAMMKAIGSHVICVRRTVAEKPDFADEVYTSDQLDEVLPRADVIAMAVPGSSATHQMLNAARFALMKDGVIIANVGRGVSIDTDALCDALDSGKVGAAFLDVTDPEPLPADHPLWSKEGAIITPHIAGGFNMSETMYRLANIVAGNIHNYIAGLPLENIVDRSTGYKKH